MNRSPWPPPSGEPAGPRHNGIGIPVVFTAWVLAYLAAVVLGGSLLAWAGHAEGDSLPPWLVLGSSLALWAPQVASVWIVSKRVGTGRLRDDYGIRFSVRDLWGVPIGIASQLILVNVVMLPLRLAFPERFSVEEVERRARELVESTQGLWWLAIIFVVVIGAPAVEELVYRGFIQGSLQQRIAPFAALVLTAVWFTVVHLQPVEFPGLLAFALVLGWCRLKTGNIGMAWVAHVAFNVAGLSLVVLTV